MAPFYQNPHSNKFFSKLNVNFLLGSYIYSIFLITYDQRIILRQQKHTDTHPVPFFFFTQEIPNINDHGDRKMLLLH